MFKPGMHQIVESKKVDFNAIVAKMAGVQPQASYPMMGWGKKFLIKATLKKPAGDRIEVEFFCELTFPQAPSNPSLGYTREDPTIFSGVSIVNFEAEKDGVRQSHGEVLAYEDFVEQYITDPQTRVVLDRTMESMSDMMAVTEQTIDRVNNAWENRDPGGKELYSIQYN